MKRTFFTLLSLTLFLVLINATSSCSDWKDEDGNSALASLEHAPPIVRQAQCLLEGKTLRSVDVHSGVNTSPYKSKKTRSASCLHEKLEPDWTNYLIVCHGSEDALVVPLKRKSLTAYAELTENGRILKNVLQVKSKLVVRRDSVDGSLIPAIVTFLYDRNYLSSHRGLVDSLGYDLKGVDFTGYYITSRIDGTMLLGMRYVKGKERFRFCANPLEPFERDSCETDDDIHLYISLASGIVETRALTVDDIDVEDVSNLRCSFCNKSFDNCQCVVITTCRFCKKRKEECICEDDDKKYCSSCNQLVINGRCNCCLLCASYPCICYKGNGGNGDSGSGIGGSSGSSGGTGSSGGSGLGDGNAKPGGEASNPTKIPTETLSSKAKGSVDLMRILYGNQMAVCNLGVQALFKQIFGSSNLPPGMSGLANDMVTAWSGNPAYWQSISLSEAQSYANQGYFVVAGYYNANGSGHVVVIVPGEEVSSASWGCKVPHTMDTGRNKRSSQMPLSQSFSSRLKQYVYFYYYRK